MMPKSIDISGQRFGKLIARRSRHTVSGDGYDVTWSFQCDCGCHVTMLLRSLRNAVRLGRRPMCNLCQREARQRLERN